MPDLSIVIVTYNSAGCIRPCLESIDQTRGGLSIEQFVVDNASRDDTSQIVEEHAPEVTLIRNTVNAGFPAANNQALTLARGRYILLLNPDTIVAAEAFQAMVSFMDENPDCGVCGPTLIRADGTEQVDLRPPSGLFVVLQSLAVLRLWRQPSRLPDHRVEVVSGACLMFRRELLSTVGMLDPDLFWCEDMDFCVRVRRAGFRVCPVRAARVIHLEGQSAASNIGLKTYVINASLIGFAQKNAPRLDRYAILGSLPAQVLVRAVLWGVIARVRPSKEASARRDALLRVLRALPTLLRRSHWTKAATKEDA